MFILVLYLLENKMYNRTKPGWDFFGEGGINKGWGPPVLNLSPSGFQTGLVPLGTKDTWRMKVT